MKTQSIKSHARDMLSGVSNSSRLHRLPDNETNMMIPSDLATMVRYNGSTSDYKIILMTPHISDLVAEVQQEKNWPDN